MTRVGKAGIELGGRLYERYRAAVADEPLPVALVDLDAFDRNLDRVLAPLRAAGKKLRVATKSIRCPALIERVLSRAGEAASGLMTYTATETAFLASRGHKELLLAYPTVRRADL